MTYAEILTPLLSVISRSPIARISQGNGYSMRVVTTSLGRPTLSVIIPGRPKYTILEVQEDIVYLLTVGTMFREAQARASYLSQNRMAIASLITDIRIDYSGIAEFPGFAQDILTVRLRQIGHVLAMAKTIIDTAKAPDFTDVEALVSAWNEMVLVTVYTSIVIGTDPLENTTLDTALDIMSDYNPHDHQDPRTTYLAQFEEVEAQANVHQLHTRPISRTSTLKWFESIRPLLISPPHGKSEGDGDEEGEGKSSGKGSGKGKGSASGGSGGSASSTPPPEYQPFSDEMEEVENASQFTHPQNNPESSPNEGEDPPSSSYVEDLVKNMGASGNSDVAHTSGRSYDQIKFAQACNIQSALQLLINLRSGSREILDVEGDYIDCEEMVLAVVQGRDLNNSDIYRTEIRANYRHSTHLYLDCSSSMSDSDMSLSREIVVQLLEVMTGLSAPVSLTTYPGGIVKGLHDILTFTKKQKIASISSYGSTPLEEVFMATKGQIAPGDVVIFLTDGWPDTTCEPVTHALHQFQCPSLCIGINTHPNHPEVNRNVEVKSAMDAPMVIYRFMRDVAGL